MTPSANAGTIIASNRLLSRQLQRAHEVAMRTSGARVWESPNILPHGAWLRRLWNELAAREPSSTPVLLTRIQEETLWRQAIGEASELLDLNATASVAARAWELLHAWQLPFEQHPFLESAETEAFFGWATFFRDALRTRDWITSSELGAALAERGFAFDSPLEYAGFHELTPRERDLFSACRASPHTFADCKPPAFLCAALPDQAAEIEAAALWARAKLEKHAVSIGVVIPGLAQQRAAVERIFDDVLNPGLSFARNESRMFHISAGKAASEHPLIAAALLVLGLEPGLSLAEAGALLRSPFLRLDATGGAKLDAHLRRRRMTIVHTHDLREHLPQWSRHTAEDLLSEVRRPAEWSAIFSKLVTASGWPGERTPTHAERRAIEQWKDLLSALAGLDQLQPQLSYNRALGQLRRIAKQSRFNEDGGDGHDAPVQLLDLNEAAEALPGLRFDALWMAGMHAGAWPAPAVPNPFLPRELQTQAGVAHSSPQLELARARRITQLLWNAAEEIVCSYPKSAGEEALRVSALIEKHFDTVPLLANGPADTMLARIAQSAPLLELGAADAPALPNGTEAAGGARLLEDQAACPIRAFAVHRLGARELDELEIGVSPRERGGAVHRALEWVWKELKTQATLLNYSPGELTALAESAAAQALKNNNAPERFRRLEHRRLVDLLLKWLEKERHRQPFEVVEQELDRKAELGGLILKIRPDRMDRYEDGSHAVLDYKTSKDLKMADWDGDRPAAPQLPLYAVRAGKHVSEVMFAKLTALEVAPLSRRGGELRESLPEWERVLETLARDFVAGHAEVDPHYGRKTCQNCRLPAFCRVSELGYPTIEGDDE